MRQNCPGCGEPFFDEFDDDYHECAKGKWHNGRLAGTDPSALEAVCEKHRGTYTVTCGPACNQAGKVVYQWPSIKEGGAP